MVHKKLVIQDMVLNDVQSLSNVFKKVSINGLKTMHDGEQLVFLPSILMVLNYNDHMKENQREMNFVSSKYVET
jgi:hypothetical protein